MSQQPREPRNLGPLYLAITVALPMTLIAVLGAATNQQIWTTPWGWVATIAVVVVLAVVMSRLFKRRAAEMEGASPEAAVRSYDEDCDPEPLTEFAQAYVVAREGFDDESDLWLAGYCAQALLDLGRVDAARSIEQNMVRGVSGMEDAAERAIVTVNLVPLEEKLNGHARTLPVIEQALQALDGVRGVAAAQARAYLETQRHLAQAHASADVDVLMDFYAQARANDALPMRLRVECAWEEAQIHFKRDDAPAERAALEFVAENGGALALAARAQARLAGMAQADGGVQER
ncbi:MAG: hypothetical protein Q4C41_08695 [Eggerthellaceae bacterium]|nr:hypothetical protein [Eggerthellaceae bacterium]